MSAGVRRSASMSGSVPLSKPCLSDPERRELASPVIVVLAQRLNMLLTPNGKPASNQELVQLAARSLEADAVAVQRWHLPIPLNI